MTRTRRFASLALFAACHLAAAAAFAANPGRAEEGRRFADKLVQVAFPVQMEAHAEISRVDDEAKPYSCRVATLTLSYTASGLSIEQACYAAVYSLQRKVEAQKAPWRPRSGQIISTQ